MSKKKDVFRVAMPAWEIGRVRSGLGAKVGGLGVIVEELPVELVKAAKAEGMTLEVEVLSPCFAFYDKSRMTKLTDVMLPVTLDGHTFEFEAYQYTFEDGITATYFWDEWQLSWTTPAAIYPDDPEMAHRLFAGVSQAMAAYIKQRTFHTVHSHDYHVGLVPFYLGDEYLAEVPHHFTIHNATYQGRYPAKGIGFERLWQINLPGDQLFHKYFDHFDYINVMKAVLIKTHETGGKVTTVSGDINGTWGYAAELREGAGSVWHRARMQKWWGDVGEVFVPNQYLDVFEKLPVAGITNGMSDQNRAENLPYLKAEVLQEAQTRQPWPLFSNPEVQERMLNTDHNFSVETLSVKAELKDMLLKETLGYRPEGDPIIITVVGRLVDQKNLGLVGDIIERTIAHDSQVRFVMLASAPDGDYAGKATENHFFHLAHRYPHHVYYNNAFNLPLSKLIMAGGDFMLIPSKFEPCGLVDYEASLLGTVVIARRTGGLAKVQHCGYLYDWLDVSDRYGEANAFFEQIKNAIDTYRQNPARHAHLRLEAMKLDASWAKSAGQYIKMYRYGLLAKRWIAARQALLPGFIDQLGDDLALFRDYFIPANDEYGDPLNWLLRERL